MKFVENTHKTSHELHMNFIERRSQKHMKKKLHKYMQLLHLHACAAGANFTSSSSLRG